LVLAAPGAFSPAAAWKKTFLSLVFGRLRPKTKEKEVRFHPAAGETRPCRVSTNAGCGSPAKKWYHSGILFDIAITKEQVNEDLRHWRHCQWWRFGSG
jgi:hypothetical protein